MRHGKKFNHLKRKKGHRRALLMNMSCALIKHKRITTTLAKGKALRVYLEPLITKARTNTTHSRRVVFSYLQNKEAVTELFGPVAAKIADRPGGYLRILRTGFRQGDAAETCLIEFVDYNETYSTASGPKKKTRRRRGGGGGGGSQQPAPAEASTPTDAVADVADEAVDTVVDVAEEVDTPDVVDVATDVVDDATDAVTDVADNATDIVDDVTDAVADAADDVKDA